MKPSILSKKLPIRIIGTLLITAITIVSCAPEEDPGNPGSSQLPESVVLKETALYPEGIVYSNDLDQFLVGSYYKGKVMKVDLDGNMSLFIDDDRLVSVVGLAIDSKRKRLVVTNSDSGFGEGSDASTIGQIAEVLVYDLNTADLILEVDLSGLIQGGHFINDVVVDPDGNIYATDSFSPAIYKIDSDGNASVLVANESFMPPQGAFGLNGIVYNTAGYLITGLAYNGKLFKIPVNNPSEFTEISVSQNINSMDGLEFISDNILAVVSNNITGAPYQEAVYQLVGSNSWEEASVEFTHPATDGTFPTTLTTVRGALYVNYAYFSNLIMGLDPVQEFNIQKVNF